MTGLAPQERPVVPARFWARTEVDDAGCWLWTGALTSDGYGQTWTGSRTIGRRNRKAHRVAYELTFGPIPNGLTIDHLCRTRRCINPAHLEAVPHGVNVLRGNAPTAINAAKTHCVRGHEFNPENTYVDALGARCCRPCRRRRDGFRRERERAAALEEAS